MLNFHTHTHTARKLRSTPSARKLEKSQNDHSKFFFSRPFFNVYVRGKYLVVCKWSGCSMTGTQIDEDEGKWGESGRKTSREGREAKTRKKGKRRKRVEARIREGKKESGTQPLSHSSEVSAGFTARPTLASLVTQNYNVEASQKFRSNDTGTRRVALNISF